MFSLFLHQATNIPQLSCSSQSVGSRSADWQFLANLDLVESKFQGKYAAQLPEKNFQIGWRVSIPHFKYSCVHSLRLSPFRFSMPKVDVL